MLVSVVGPAIVVTLTVFRRRVKESGGRRFYYTKLALPIVSVAVLAAVVTYVALPKLPKADVQTFPGGALVGNRFPLRILLAIHKILDQNPTLAERDEQGLADAILQKLPEKMPAGSLTDQRHVANLLQGGHVRSESSPGNFTVEKRDGKFIVRVYDQKGRPLLDEF